MPKPVTQENLVGVWRRNYIRRANGDTDTTSRVWWVQALPHFADLRIPAGRPPFSGVRTWTECNATQQAWLRSQQGFAGTLTPHNGAWMWEHEMNIRPEEMGQKDSGFLRFTDDSGNMMIENCVDGTYSEEWERIDDAAQTGGCGLLFRSARGMMVVAGAHFIMVRNSEDPLLEISHGAAAGAMNTWLITNSTLPWCEGEVLVRPDEIWYAAP